jgi:hypothetical protein
MPWTRVTCDAEAVNKNLTLTLDESLLKSARKLAVERDTSVNQLVREFLENLVKEASPRQAALAEIDEIFRTTRIKMGKRTWTREDLHERR